MNTIGQQSLSTRADTDRVSDTFPRSRFWEPAPRILMNGDTDGKEVPGHTTEVRSRWTPENLYFLFICPYEKLHLKPSPSVRAKTNDLWHWDVAEAFIGCGSGPIHRYKEFEISPQGEWLDLDIDLSKPGKIGTESWNSGFKAAARIEPQEKTWYGFMRIPYAAIEDGKRAAAGNTLRINFFRSQGPSHIEIAWQAPHQESFHAPEHLGILRLIE